jgi:3-dehydroquinate synthetase
MAGVCEENWLEILSETINRHFKPVNYLRSDIPNLIDYCRKDKKNENDDIIIVPVREAGNPLVKMPISSKILTGAFEQYCNDTAQMC